MLAIHVYKILLYNMDGMHNMYEGELMASAFTAALATMATYASK